MGDVINRHTVQDIHCNYSDHFSNSMIDFYMYDMQNDSLKPK